MSAMPTRGMSKPINFRVSPHSDLRHFAGQLGVTCLWVRGPAGVSPQPVQAFLRSRRSLWIFSFYRTLHQLSSQLKCPHTRIRATSPGCPEYPPTGLAGQPEYAPSPSILKKSRDAIRYSAFIMSVCPLCATAYSPAAFLPKLMSTPRDWQPSFLLTGSHHSFTDRKIKDQMWPC